MAKDHEEALQRLEEALWEDESLSEEQTSEEQESAAGGVIYRNYSNGYGSKLRNYASGYRAYNTDRCDVELDEYSDRVRKGRPIGPAILAGLLSAGLIAALLLWLLKLGGFL